MAQLDDPPDGVLGATGEYARRMLGIALPNTLLL